MLEYGDIVGGPGAREGGEVAGTDILDVAGEDVCFEELEVMGAVILGALSSAVLSGGTVTEVVVTGSGGAETVFTTATVGGAPTAVMRDKQIKCSHAVIRDRISCTIPVESRLTGAEELLCGPCPALLQQETRNLKLLPRGRSVTL